MHKLFAILFLLPTVAWATGKPKPPPSPVVIKEECRSCKKDRIGWIVAGVVGTVVFYETGGADYVKKHWLGVKPTQTGAMLTYGVDF